MISCVLALGISPEIEGIFESCVALKDYTTLGLYLTRIGAKKNIIDLPVTTNAWYIERVAT